MVREWVENLKKSVKKERFRSSVNFCQRSEEALRWRDVKQRRRCGWDGVKSSWTVSERTCSKREKGFSAGSSRDGWPFSAATWADFNAASLRQEKWGPAARVLTAQLRWKREQFGRFGRLAESRRNWPRERGDSKGESRWSTWLHKSLPCIFT